MSIHSPAVADLNVLTCSCVQFSTIIVFFIASLILSQEYMYPDARDRQYLRFLHQAASKSKFDIAKYNQLRDEIGRVEADLDSARKPLIRPSETEGVTKE